MPKLKTNKAAKKRYSYTATGKVKRTKSNRRHLLANKTSRAKARGKLWMLMQIKHVKQELRNYYHTATKIQMKSFVLLR